MKPDKIYIQEGAILRTEKTYDNDVCYIRKEVLLKKLEKVAAEYKKRSDDGELVWQNMRGIKEAIDILNKM